MTRPTRRFVAALSSIAFLCGVALPTAMAGAAQASVTVRNFTDRAVTVRLVNSPTAKYCIASHSETHFNVQVTSASIMQDANGCHGAVAHEYHVEANALLVELGGSKGKYHVLVRSN